MDTPDEGKEARTLTLAEKKEYHALSVKDLLEARDAYHVFLTRKKNVIGTAIGKIRKRKKGVDKSEPKTLENSEVWSDYAWPCVLVFVKEWISEADFGKGGKASYDDYLPRSLYLPDGREIPVCVIQSKWQAKKPDAIAHMRFPGSVIGGGYPVLTRVQGQDRWATLSCLVSDGRLTYALTNAHVAGRPGEELITLKNGNEHVIGRAGARQLSKEPFSQVYETFPGKHALLNLDIGLIELDDLDGVSSQVFGLGEVQGIVDVSHDNLSLGLIGCPVKGYGCASGLMKGEISALFYRYASAAGYEYIADYLVGPRHAEPGEPVLPFSPRNGDSGTLLVVDDPDLESDVDMKAIGILWGGQKHMTEQTEQPYALVTNLASICRMLDVELVCSWNTGYDRYFGAYAHTVLPSLAADVIKDETLKELMKNNAGAFSMPLGETEVNATHGLSDEVFVPLSDVPDLVWKSRTGKFKRGKEGPNHFADMDEKDPKRANKTLLDLCANDENVDPVVWGKYYKEVKAKTKGTLPFRVAQIYDAMVEAVRAGNKTEFVAAAGILTHYVFDACMPLHISRLYNGDPDGAMKTIKDGSEKKQVPLAYGVHDDFDNSMVEYHRVDLINCLPGFVMEKDHANAPVRVGDITGPKSAAVATVELMQHTFEYANPAKIVKDYEGLVDEAKRDRCDALWDKYGSGKQQAMAEGVVLLARLWQAAWEAGDGATEITDTSAVPEPDLTKLYETKEGFLDSVNLAEIKSTMTWDG